MLKFFFQNQFFYADWLPFNFLKNTFFESYTKYHDSNENPLKQSFINDKDLLMKTSYINSEVNREQLSWKTPKVILERLNINRADSILILNNKLYIEKKNMTGQKKSGRRNLVLKGEKIYEEYNGSLIKLNTPTECSLFYKKPTQIKSHLINAQNDISCSPGRPLRQINGNACPKFASTPPNFERKNELNATETTSFQFLNRSLHKNDREHQSSHIQKQKREAINGILLPSALINKPLKRLRSDTSKQISRSNIPFHNRCKDSRTNERNLESPRKIPLVSPRLKVPRSSCKVILERIDAKICFMDYFRLKPTVKTDVRKMYELSLLRKYKIRKCNVVISRLPVELKRKTCLADYKQL